MGPICPDNPGFPHRPSLPAWPSGPTGPMALDSKRRQPKVQAKMMAT